MPAGLLTFALYV